MSHCPVIGITTDTLKSAKRPTLTIASAYVDAVSAAGGLPLLIPHRPELTEDYLDRMDGLVLSGGDDPDMAAFGEATHPQACVMDPERQALELALLEGAQRRDLPVLGVCLGMQLMALREGGKMDQYMPESMGEEAAAKHWDGSQHAVRLTTSSPLGPAGSSLPDVCSHHRQRILDSGQLMTCAEALDGTIEAVCDPHRQFWLGVQWHPERTERRGSGQMVFDRLIAACM